MKYTTISDNRQCSNVYQALEFQKEVVARFAKNISDIETLRMLWNNSTKEAQITLIIKGL